MQRTFTRTITVEFTLTDVFAPGQRYNQYDELPGMTTADVVKSEQRPFLWEWFKNTEYELILDQITETQPAVAS